MNYSFSQGFDQQVETFLQLAMTAFDDLYPNASDLDKSVLFMILADLEKYGGKVISSNLENLTSYQKISAFIDDIYTKYVNQDDIYDIKYSILSPTDFGYRVALDLIKPVSMGLEEFNRKSDLAHITKRELYSSVNHTDTELTAWDRPVAQVAEDKVLVATHI